MSVKTIRWTTLAAMFFISLGGCSYFQNGGVDDDADLTDMDDVEKAEPSDRIETAMAKESRPAEGQLELKLKVGDQFPLSKTVEQRLTQTDKDGVTVSTSQTDMMLSLIVDKVQPDGRKQMTVRYHRVNYRQDIRGQQITYSSTNQVEPIPPEALLYSGLADNWFSFWVGPNNKVVETVGFNDFLRRCLRNVPAQYVAVVQQQLETTKTEDGIANFIDDSIGLLPYSTDPDHPAVAVKEGSHWDLEPRRTDAPFPMLTTTRCLLKELSPISAEILISGQISGPPAGVTVHSPDGDLKILVKGGHSTGTCRVDRKTGLPTQSQVMRYLELAMQLPDGQRIQQNKETVSTITSFLEQTPQSASNANRRVQPVSVQNAGGTENHRRVTHAGGSTKN